MKVKRISLAALFVAPGKEPPREFLVFPAGRFGTTKGEYLFDDQAAQLVMDEFLRHGVQKMIDLEHLSLDDKAPNYDPDARGWYDLEVRDGALWAVNVTWTPDGDMRLRQGTQRYMSPAFAYDEKTGRIIEVFNIAICAIPATYDTPALVAASKRSGLRLATLTEGSKMDLKKLASALGLKEDATEEDCMNAIKALREDGSEEGDGDSEEEASDDADGDKDGDKKDEESSDDKDADEKMADKLAAAFGAKKAAKLLGKIVGFDALSERVAKIEKETTEDAVSKLIADNTDKIPASLEKWARKQTPAALREFLSGAPVVRKEAHKQPKQEGEQQGENFDESKVKLTADEKKIAKLSNMKEADVLKQKIAKLRAKFEREQSARD